MGKVKNTSRKRLLISNILVYGFGGIISKLIPIIMVPITTRLFPSSFYYGLNDLSSTIVSFFSALAIMGMYDAMYRMFFEKEDDGFKKDICSSAFVFSIMTSTAIFFIMLIFQNQIAQLFYSDRQYANLVMLSAVSVLIGSTNSIISAPTRMQNKKKTYLIINTISPIVSYAISIPMILKGYYIIALPLAGIITSFITELTFAILNGKWFSLKRVNWSYIRSMLKIALPLLPNFIIYWIFNSSDKIMIAKMLGTAEEGIYSVAGKVGQISNLIYTAFAGGWQYFAFSIMNDEDNVKVVSKIFEVLTIISLVTTLLGTSICKWGMELIFTKEYWSGYTCIPYLYLAPLLLMLFQVGTNQFLVIKKTWPNLVILSAGALINIILNFVFIPIIGIEGASIATFVGYLVSIILCVLVLKKFKLLTISWRLICTCLLFVVSFVVMRLNSFTLYYINIPVAIAYCVALLMLYRKDVERLLYKIKEKKRAKVINPDSSSEEGVEMSLAESCGEEEILLGDKKADEKLEQTNKSNVDGTEVEIKE